jgi:hypothetical protein
MVMRIAINYGTTLKTMIDNDIVKTEKAGTDTVAGRAVTVYTYSQGGADVKFWLDNELGLVLKTEGGASDYEFTSFKIGGAQPDDFTDLNDYDLK